MRVAEAASAEFGNVGSMRDGVLALKFLLSGEEDSPNNYALWINRAGSGGWSTPRHRHNFDQLRYILKGNYPYAKGKVMPEGTVAYFPESVYYGPQDRPEGLEMLTLQFGGASGQGFLSVSKREAANEALKKKGEFKNGIYTYIDANGQKHNKDGSAACFEEAVGRKLTFAKPRYDDLVLMDPANYEWIPEAIEGISSKWLGAFTERNTRIGFTRIEAGASFPAGEQPSIELLFVNKGRVTIEGREYGPQTAFEFLANEGPIALKAIVESELFRIILPRF